VTPHDAGFGSGPAARYRGAGPAPHGCGSEHGSETVEIVIIIPVLMAILALGLQLVLWGLAAHALSLGVADGGAAARAPSGSAEQAAAVVADDIHTIAGSLVGALQVTVKALPHQYMSVSAHGEAPSIFPGLRLPVSSESTGPMQTFRASG
jgi:hypothetical protein